MKEFIEIKGARQHNLKNIDLKIPKNKFVCFCGLSGSGKSSLAFDTIYAEGQRRYVESLSSYARQFLGNSSKPDVDVIDGLSPAISIEQKTTSKNPRSTVGTTTEIYDFLRLLFARVGTAYCHKCNSKIEPQSEENIVNLLMSEKGKEFLFLAPKIVGQKGTYEKLFEDLLKEGFVRVRVDGEIYRLEDIKNELKLLRYERHWIEIVIDRIKICDDNRQRINEAVSLCIENSKGSIKLLDLEKEKNLRKEKKF